MLTQNMALKSVLSIIKKQPAPIFALYGDLGVGKTFFVKQVAKNLGIQEEVTSPTFLILKTYQIPKDDRLLVHIDFYRLKDNPNHQILNDIALYDFLLNDIIFIEWPSIIFKFLPTDIQKQIIKIYINKDEYNNRLYKIQYQNEYEN